MVQRQSGLFAGSLAALVFIAWMFEFHLLFSFLLGVSACAIPSFVFFKVALLRRRDALANAALRQFYLGGFMKFLSMVVICVFMMRWVHPEPMFFFIGFLCVQMILWVVYFRLSVEKS